MMSNSIIYITIGIPGSGKSHLAKKLPKDVIELNLDDLRAELTGDESFQGSTMEALVIRDERLSCFISNNKNVIISDTNIITDHLYSLIGTILSLGVKPFNIIIIDMDVPLELCLERNSSRKRKVPEDVIKYYHDLYTNNLPIITSKFFNTKFKYSSDIQ